MAHYKGAATEATRAMHIMKRRERAREELELKKRRVEEDIKLSTIDNKFATHHYDAIEAQLRTSTVGLVTLDQMRRKQVDAVKEREKQIARNEDDTTGKTSCRKEGSTKPQQNKTKSLSFGDDDDDDDEDDEDAEKELRKYNEKCNIGSPESITSSDREVHDDGPSHIPIKLGDDLEDERQEKKMKGGIALYKGLDMDTSLLPDKEREEEERKLREQLAAEWREKQQKLKEEEIDITFSYWDGSGHRRVVRMKKGNSIYQFLQACLETLRKDFNELRSVAADHLMYVKEDLIIPHHYTFYDFIVTKARGKSGPLFSFDVHDDVRLIADASVEKDESHAGKVLIRSWYERNKHIFPASRWEPYDPTKSYEKYTISDKRAK